jgi:hypothetical protein
LLKHIGVGIDPHMRMGLSSMTKRHTSGITSI